MSADNWTVCPKCVANRVKDVENAQSIIDSGYGAVSEQVYKDALTLLNLNHKYVQPKTLREDWEIGIFDGQFEYSYRASCRACDFRFNRSEEEEI